MTDLVLDGTDALGAELVASYAATLGTDKSRSTFAESLLRVARVLDASDPQRIPWGQLDFDGMNLIRAKLRRRYAPQTANMTLSHVRNVVRIGFIKGLVSERAWLGVKEAKGVRGSRAHRGRALNKDELVDLLDGCGGSTWPRGPMLRAVLLLGVGTGLRLNEICALSMSGVREGKVFVVGKGNKENECVLDRVTAKALHDWMAIRQELRWSHRRVFGSPARGRVLSAGWLWRMLHELAKEADVKSFAPHDLRRTFATRMFETGFDLREVQQLMNHSSPDTTARYDKRGRLALENKRRAVIPFEV
jgi:integrase/recombinase XerD